MVKQQLVRSRTLQHLTIDSLLSHYAFHNIHVCFECWLSANLATQCNTLAAVWNLRCWLVLKLTNRNTACFRFTALSKCDSRLMNSKHISPSTVNCDKITWYCVHVGVLYFISLFLFIFRFLWILLRCAHAVCYCLHFYFPTTTFLVSPICTMFMLLFRKSSRIILR